MALVSLCVSGICLLAVQPDALATGQSTRPHTVRQVSTGSATLGGQLWVSRYNATANNDAAQALGVSPDGSTVFVTGYSVGSMSGADYATVAYDASTGAQLWAKRYNGSANTGDVARALSVNPAGSAVFVTGRSHGSATGDDYATVAYDASTGAKLWARRYTGPKAGDDEATALGVSPDGSDVFVTGHSHGSGSGADYATVAYDASSGKELWVSSYNAPANGDDAALALGVSPDGSAVFATGRSIGSTSSLDYATVGYDASTGAQLWVSRYDGPATGDDVALALGVSPDGSTVFVTGDSLGSGTGADYATVAYQASKGVELWVSRYNAPASDDDAALAFGISPDGLTLFVTGESHGLRSGADYATVAYQASNGAQLWVRRYNGSANGDDGARALVVSPDGSTVFVTGHSHGSGSGADYATVAYQASTGARLWMRRYSGLANSSDVATGLGVSPDGSTVFATGRSIGSTSGYDYATVAYSSA